MKKGIAIIAITMLFVATLFSSCQSKELCPAYTDSQQEIESNEEAGV
ncbi:MAG: hypothetical protein R6U11_04265 [Bacteroidales bacterium]